jgi:hypothetical protein
MNVPGSAVFGVHVATQKINNVPFSFQAAFAELKRQHMKCKWAQRFRPGRKASESLVERVTSSGKAAVRAEYSNLAISGVKGVPGKLLAGPTAGSSGQPDYELASVGKRRDWWASVSKEYPLLAAAACRVLALHPSSAAAERNWSAWGRQFPANRAGMAVSTSMKAIYVQVNNVDAHDGISRELMLSLKGKDEPAGELAEHEGQV